MNQMDKVIRLLELEFFQKFDIVKERPNILQKLSNPYYFTDEGMVNKYGVRDNALLAELIIGSLKIEKIKATAQK